MTERDPDRDNVNDVCDSPLSETIQRIDTQRRKLIAAMGGASTVAVTGCLGLLNGGSRRRNDDRITAEDDSETSETRDGTPGTDGEETTTGEDETTTVETFDITWVNEGNTTISVPSAPRTSDGAVPGNDSLLDNALDEGLSPPWQCGRGICGACTSKVDGNGHDHVEHGKGEYTNQYLSDEQIEAGYILTCVGWPKQDFALETGMTDEADDIDG